jgi:hypothetical protein
MTSGDVLPDVGLHGGWWAFPLLGLLFLCTVVVRTLFAMCTEYRKLRSSVPLTTVLTSRVPQRTPQQQPAPQPVPLDPDLCVAYGPGLHGAKQGEETSFTIQTRDAEGNNMRTGGHSIAVSVGDKLERAPAVVKDNKDGTYLAKYIPTNAGTVEVEVLAESRPIWKSPWTVVITPEAVHAPSCVASGAGLSRSQLGRDASFVVSTFGKGGLPVPLPKKGLELEISVSPTQPKGKDAAAVPVVRDLGRAQYEVKYSPVQGGEHKISVSILGVPIKSSPFRMFADAGKPFGPASCAIGEGLHDATEGREAFFTVKASDQAGNPVLLGGYQVQARLAGQGTKTNCKVKDNQDGTTAVKYLAPAAGQYQLDVVLESKPIVGSPFVVTVHPVGLDALKCQASGPGLESAIDGMQAYFYILTRNKLGTPTTAGKSLQVNLSSPLGPLAKACEEVEVGKYLVKYQPICSGDHIISITVDGADIPGSVFRVPVKKGPLELLYELRPVLGVEVTNESTEHQGLKVLALRMGGPCDQGGIRRDEHLSAVDGVELSSSKTLEDYKFGTTPGDVVEFRVVSESGSQRRASVVVGAQGVSAEDVAQLRLTAGVSERKWDRRAFAQTKPHLLAQ